MFCQCFKNSAGGVQHGYISVSWFLNPDSPFLKMLHLFGLILYWKLSVHTSYTHYLVQYNHVHVKMLSAWHTFFQWNQSGKSMNAITIRWCKDAAVSLPWIGKLSMNRWSSPWIWHLQVPIHEEGRPWKQTDPGLRNRQQIASFCP